MSDSIFQSRILSVILPYQKKKQNFLYIDVLFTKKSQIPKSYFFYGYKKWHRYSPKKNVACLYFKLSLCHRIIFTKTKIYSYYLLCRKVPRTYQFSAFWGQYILRFLLKLTCHKKVLNDCIRKSTESSLIILRQLVISFFVVQVI